MSGVTYLLDRVRGSDDPVIYRGGLSGEICCEIEVRVTQNETSVDGFSAEVEAIGAPRAHLETIERTAKVMVKSAVRRAHKDGMPPPRRIQRWRERC